MTCYREQRIEDLNDAQRRRIAHIINKLRIKDEMRVLDVGCGWGGLALEIAKQSKACVVGISLSAEQVRYAKKRAAEAGLSQRLRFELIDYRNITGVFDRIVAAGVLEHVGKSHYLRFFKCLERSLAPEGILLVDTIGRVGPRGGTDPWLRKYIFAGGYIPSLTEITRASEVTRLMLLDVEVFRVHYAFTVREWRRRFLQAAGEIKEKMGDQFIRMWELYLVASEMASVYGRFVNYQVLLSKSRFAAPITRDYMVSTYT